MNHLECCLIIPMDWKPIATAPYAGDLEIDLATEFLFLRDAARLPFGSDLPEHFPSLTATLLLVSNLLALFRWQIPATLLPTARDRLAFGFQSRQPSRASRPHAR
jgi:hypothetical protein